jgi:hypothetical protein
LDKAIIRHPIQAIDAYIDNYCEAKPLDKIIEAADALAQELKQ